MTTHIGQRIRKMREAQGLTVYEVSTLVGVGAERLTAIEDGHGLPSVGQIIKLSRVLGSKVDGILHGGATMTRPLTLCRAGEVAEGEEQGDTDQGYTYRTLGRPSAGQGMEPLLITFTPGEPDSRPIAHDGQEFVYVLEGRVELLHDGQRCTLGPGDSVYLDSSRPHQFRAVGDAPSKAVGVVWSAG
jgi:quercetin dioxygenase-like cupin family protein/DNA-binding XRE family transcriptional regulator